MKSTQETAQDAARWYARLRAPDCTDEERAEFERWLRSDPRNTVAYESAELLGEALAKLAVADPRLKAMADQAASAGSTLPDDAPDTTLQKPAPLTITTAPGVSRSRRRIAMPFGWATAFAAALIGILILVALGESTVDDGSRYSLAGGPLALRYLPGFPSPPP